ncbi:MAG: hypothetical protein MJ107_03250 [Lachnospiraceae bacterium]|nr:hypothetical protein [Lachnospiraceae bacterium]
MKISSLLSDGCVLQRDSENKIWGQTNPLSDVTVKLIYNTEIIEEKACKATEKGNFSIAFSPIKKGGPYSIEISDSIETVVINDVLFGDVFLLMGQSNMELPVARTLDLNREYAKKINNTNIRHFEVPKEWDFKEKNDDIYKGVWKKATQENVYQFSALGFYFAEYVNADYDVPVGLLQTGCGGIQIEALIEEERLLNVGKILKSNAIARGEKGCTCGKNQSCKFCYEEVIARDKSDEFIENQTKADAKEQNEFNERLSNSDPGLKADYINKTTLFTPDETPRYINVPERWEAPNDSEFLHDVRGSVWCLKNFDVPPELVGKPARLYLGTIIDADETYINGVKVGETFYRYPPRRYEVKEGITREHNTLVVRVKVSQRYGGFVPEMPYYLDIEGNKIPLDGKYEVKIGANFTAEDGVVNNLPDSMFFLYRPCGMYNKMIYPLRNMSVKAFLFYQGESNSKMALDYDPLMREMVKGVRELFGEKLPLAFVQLPFFGQEDDDRGTSIWDDFRAVQAGLSNIPDSVMVDAYDLGFRYELHPQTKRELARRLFDNFKYVLYSN